MPLIACLPPLQETPSQLARVLALDCASRANDNALLCTESAYSTCPYGARCLHSHVPAAKTQALSSIGDVQLTAHLVPCHLRALLLIKPFVHCSRRSVRYQQRPSYAQSGTAMAAAAWKLAHEAVEVCKYDHQCSVVAAGWSHARRQHGGTKVDRYV